MSARRLNAVPDVAPLFGGRSVGGIAYRSYMAKTLAERYWPKVDKRGRLECWPWLASCVGKGYGQISRGPAGAGNEMAHRVGWELAHGPIPPGMQIDHLCRNRICQNPAHMQVVDARTNLLKTSNGAASTNSRKSHCVHGHPLMGDNVQIYRGTRVCLSCRKRKNDVINNRRKAARLAAREATE